MKIRIALLLLAFAALGAHAGLEPVYEPKNVPVEAGREVTAEQVKQAFLNAAIDIKGWTFTEKEPGKLDGNLEVRKHKVVVSIPYTGKEYSILYVSSENMKYDEKARKIHGKYESWIKNLERTMKSKLLALSAPAAVPVSAPAATPAPAPAAPAK